MPMTAPERNNRPVSGFLEESQAFWSKRLERAVTAAEVQEMISSVGEFFRILDAWDRDGLVVTIKPDAYSHLPES